MLWVKEWASHKQFGVSIHDVGIDETFIRNIDCTIKLCELMFTL